MVAGRAIIALLLLVSGLLHVGAARKWTPEQFPNPLHDVKQCGRGVASWVCDPDAVLSKKGADVVEGVIKLIAQGEPPYAKGSPCGSAPAQGYEVGVALMQEFRVAPGADDATAAERFAQHLHSKWGVGRAGCQDGVLLLLSVLNRRMYISTGSGTQARLTDDQLDRIIAQARPLLKDARYDEAVQGAVVNIGLALAGHAVEPAEAEGGDWWAAGLMVGVMGLFGVAAVQGSRHARQQGARYKDCQALLNKLRRDQGALQSGAYTVDSCPICLETFAAAGDGGAEDATASADAPAQEVAAGGEGQGEGEPLLRPARPQGPPGGSALAGGSPAGGDTVTRSPMVVPCGHVFCEPCLAHWVAQQRKLSCPICRRNLEDGSEAPVTPAPPPTQGPPGGSCSDGTAEGGMQYQEQQQAWEEVPPEPVLRLRPQQHSTQATTHMLPHTHGWGRWRGAQRYTAEDLRRHRAGAGITDQQATELLRQDLMFRLLMLRRRYPDYVTSSMMHTWQDDLAHGRALSARALREFQLTDPTVKAQLQQSGSMGASRGFGGGGSSGGGRGGGW